MTKNNNGPKTEPYGKPALICDHFEVWRFRRTRWNLSDKSESISPRYSPHISMHLSLYNRPSCRTLSNALDKSRKNPLTSNDGKSDAMVSILRRHKVLLCVLKFHRDHELYFGLKI